MCNYCYFLMQYCNQFYYYNIHVLLIRRFCGINEHFQCTIYWNYIVILIRIFLFQIYQLFKNIKWSLNLVWFIYYYFFFFWIIILNKNNYQSVSIISIIYSYVSILDWIKNQDYNMRKNMWVKIWHNIITYACINDVHQHRYVLTVYI